MHPIIRHLIVCEDLRYDTANARRTTIVNLTHVIYSLDQPPFPLLHRELCVLVQATELRGKGDFWIEIAHADTGQVARRTRTRNHDFGNDPLEVVGLPFRIRDCVFSEPGLYWVQFWYNGHMVAQEPLALRARP
jgi:hypothetical protein